jgi:cathepsin L
MRQGSKNKALAALAIVGFAAVSTLFLFDNKVNSSVNFWESLTGVEGDVDVKFINYLGQYRKSYGTKEEFLFRMQNFARNYKKVQEHNAKNSSYRLGINHMSDMSEEEFKKMLGSYKVQPKEHKPLGSFIVFNTTDLPTSVDWRPTGAVTSVKDQGSCGSCYAFSAVGALEGQYWNLTKKTVDLSVEQILDCSDSYGNQGCGGGLPDWVFDYVWDNGLETEADYPYKSGFGYCNDDPRKYVLGLTHYWDVTH